MISLDIDGNDFWVIEKLRINADLIICEFNGIFGDIYEITVPYKRFCSQRIFSNLYYGCSIKSLISLLLKKKYYFMGTNSAGNNAYFLNQKNYKLIKNKIKRIKIFHQNLEGPEIQNLKKKLFYTYYEGIKLISDKKVYDLKKKFI